jgi:hypothetical protein
MLLWSAPHLEITKILAQEVGSLQYCACYPRATPTVVKLLELGHKPARDILAYLHNAHIAGLLKRTRRSFSRNQDYWGTIRFKSNPEAEFMNVQSH